MTKTKRRALRQILIVLIVMGAVVAMLFLLRKPTVETSSWKNPNKITSTMLIDSPKTFDRTTVDFTGEAIGERMVRDAGTSKNGAWLAVNDDPYMYHGVGNHTRLEGYNSGMSVWVSPASLTDGIKNYGGYKHNGDVVKVRGVFHAACAEHGGDMDIHATSLEIVRTGEPIYHAVTRIRVVIAVVLCALVLALLVIIRYRRLRERLGNFTRTEDERA